VSVAVGSVAFAAQGFTSEYWQILVFQILFGFSLGPIINHLGETMARFVAAKFSTKAGVYAHTCLYAGQLCGEMFGPNFAVWLIAVDSSRVRLAYVIFGAFWLACTSAYVLIKWKVVDPLPAVEPDVPPVPGDAAGPTKDVSARTIEGRAESKRSFGEAFSRTISVEYTGVYSPKSPALHTSLRMTSTAYTSEEPPAMHVTMSRRSSDIHSGTGLSSPSGNASPSRSSRKCSFGAACSV